MKQFYFYVLFLSFNFFISAQDNPTGSSSEVGITEGDLAVTLSGAATYSIPIAVPPGINGIVPQISLTYNSQSGNGTAGYGWNLSGISSISRIPATKFHDNTIDGVDFNAMDRFALDGQRLIVKGGTTNVYGANNTVYETENFSNIKITSYGIHPSGANYGPAYFKVEYPDGSKAFYGNSTDSRSITEWSITYFENAQGVRIGYTYNLTNNLLDISSIKYGTLTTVTPINEVQFVYEYRQRKESLYVGGQNIFRDKRLLEIKSISNSIGFRNYALQYTTTALGYDHLLSVTEKNGDKTKSYNPTVFKYNDTENTIAYYPNPNTLSVDGASSLNASTVSGDFDGDGNMDFIIYPTTGPTAKTKYWLFTGITPNTGAQTLPNFALPAQINFDEIFPVSFLSWNNKLMNVQGWTVLQGNTFTTYATSSSMIIKQDQKIFNFPRFVLDYYYQCEQPGIGLFSEPIEPDPSEPTPAHYEANIPRSFVSGDFNGDGLTDVVAIEKSFTYPYTIGCTTVTATYTGGKTTFINLDRRLTTGYANVASSVICTNNSKFFVADFNSDGKSDLFVFDTGTVRVYSLNDSKQFILLSQTTDTSIVLNKPIIIGDYNGDGKSDFMLPLEGNNGWYQYISTGISFAKQTRNIAYLVPNDPYNSYNYVAADYDNDGKSDLTVIKNSKNSSTGLGTIEVSAIIEKTPTIFDVKTAVTTAQSAINIYALPIYMPSTDQQRPRFEVAFINNNKLHFFNSKKDTNKDRLLTTITTGDGVQQLITYQPLDQIYKINFSSVYNSSGGTENYPYFDIVASPNFQIVSKLEKKSVSTSKVKLYGYYGAVSHMEGIGFLGFRSIMESNWHDSSNPALCTVVNRDIKRRGAVSESYLLSYLTYPYSAMALSNYTSKSVFTYEPTNADDAVLSNKVFKQQNTVIAEDNTLNNSTSQTTNVYDLNNNITNSTIDIKEGGSTIQKTTTTLTYQPAVTTPLYILGRPSNKTIKVDVTGNSMTTSEDYTYNAQQLLYNTDRSATGVTTISETNNTYDSFGNVKRKTITSTDSRVTDYEYDTSGRFLTKVTDPNLLSTSYEYYPENGLLKKKTDPYAQSVSYTYDSWFKVLTAKDDQLNVVTTNVYTKNGKESSITSTTTSSTSVSDSKVTEDKFDDLGRRIRSGQKDLNGTFTYISFLYDIYDRPYKISEPYFSTTTASQWNETKFDIYSRPTQSILFNTRTLSTSYQGLKTTITDGQMNKEITKNAIGNIISAKDNPLGGTINYSYFANGNLMKTSYNGIDINIQQDNWGNKTKLIDPSAGTYTYGNNTFGERTSETIAGTGITTTLTRDGANGKITKKTITGSGTNSETTYTYDGILPLTIIYEDKNEPVGYNKITTTITYDTNKRPQTIVEDKTNVSKFTRAFSYDALGRIDTETKTAHIGTASSTVKTTNKYKNGALYQIVDVNNKVLWQANTLNAKGQLLENVTGNGIKMTNTYNTDGYLSKIQHDKTTVPTANILTLTTSFDKNTDNLDSRVNSAFNNYTETFDYDGINRLTKYTNKYGTLETQTYDDSGKITANGLGTYTYDTTKKYQNTSITPTPEIIGYYANREGIFNDSMEDKTGWGLEKSPNTNFFSYDATKTPNATGKNTLKLTNTTTTEQYVYSDKWITIDNNVPTSYTYSAWVYSDNPQAELFLQMKDASNNNTYDSVVTNIKGKWTPVTKTFIVPAAVKKIRLRLDNNAQGNVWFDDVEIRKTSDPTSAVRSLIVNYNAFKAPIQIEETNVDKISFTYNDNNGRSTMDYGGFGNLNTSRPLRKHYSADGSMEIKENRTTGKFEFVTYVGGDSYTAPIAVKSNGIKQDYLYLHRDYQGSILAITDENGNVIEKRLFDAWGSIIKVQDGAGNTLNGLTILDRGYTGHEHLQSVGLIHMSARLYDPMLHRFLQVDNFIQEPANTQNYNQYGYALNNPLSYTDPTGNKYSDGKDCVECGPSNVQQGFIGGLVGTIVNNWDSWGIKDWSKRNLNFRNWGDGINSAKDFIGRNVQSGLDDIGDFFGIGGKKSEGPPPNMSSYINLAGKSTIIKMPQSVGISVKNWEKLPLLERMFTDRPNMYASSGALGFISGGGTFKFVQYSTEALNGLKKTEVFYGAAQSETAIAEIIAKMKAGDPSIYSHPVYTYVFKGEKYILNGHHRIEAAIRSGEIIEAIELSGMGLGGHFTQNLLKIEEILAGWHF
jgi:RHS repeat-associated protein